MVKVLTPINLDDELLSWSAEINNIRSNHMLPAKMNIVEPVSAQENPQLRLRLSLVTT